MIPSLLILSVALSAPVPKSEPEPVWMKKFRETYQLKDEEVVKRIPPPFIEERIDFALDAYKPPKDAESHEARRKEYREHGKWFTIYTDQIGNKLERRMTISWNGVRYYPEKQRGDNLQDPWRAVKYITGLNEPEFIIDPNHATDPTFHVDNLLVNGDFVIRKNAPLDKLASQLETILRKDCSAPIRLRVETVEQEVFVVSGKFALKPPEWRLNSTNPRLRKLIDVYSTEAGLDSSYDHYGDGANQVGPVKSSDYGGNTTEFIRHVGKRVKTRMVWDTALLADVKFTWCYHVFRKPTPQEEADDADPD